MVSFAHLQNASVPISTTLAGIVTLTTSLFQNQWLPIRSVPSGMTTCARFLRSRMFADPTTVVESGTTFVVAPSAFAA